MSERSAPTSFPKHPLARPEIELANPGGVEVAHEQVTLLKTLYAQCPERLKSKPLQFLLGQVNEYNARVVVQIVLEIGHVSDLKKALL